MELFEAERSGDTTTLRLRGGWCIDHVDKIEAALAQFPAGRERVALDCSGAETLDLSGAWLLRGWLDRARSSGAQVEFVGQSPSHFAFLDELLERKAGRSAVPDESRASLRDAVVWVGRASVQQAKQTRDAIGFFGRIAVTTVGSPGTELEFAL